MVKLCAICGGALKNTESWQEKRICSKCENILISKHDVVFKTIYPENKCNQVKVGDYVNYIPDHENARRELEANGVEWRVWAVCDDEVVIMPTEAVGRVILGEVKNFDKTFEDYKKAVSKIENECAKYESRRATSVRSLKIEDLENPNVSTLEEQKLRFGNYWYKYGEVAVSYKKGKFWPAEYDESTGKNKVLNSYRKATKKNPVKLQQTYYYSFNPGWNRLGKLEETYGALFGKRFGWLASSCADCDFDNVEFSIYRVSNCSIDARCLLDSTGSTNSHSYGVLPLISLNIKHLKLNDASSTFATWDID